jgi:cation:H+ antiporter
VVVLLLALDGNLGRFEGALLFVLLLVYTTVTVLVSRRRAARDPGSAPAGADEPGADGPVRTTSRAKRVLIDIVLVILGASLLVAGARLLVYGASAIATALGVSDLLIGLTVVAIGTSLPELVTCVVAVMRGERDMAVGNIVGSNVFNIGAVLGLTAIISPEGIAIAPAALRFDLPIMVAVALVLLPIALTQLDVARWEGALLVGFYAAYIAYLVVEATDHSALQPFSAAMLWFVIPLTALWLLYVTVHELITRRRAAKPGDTPATPSVKEHEPG